MFFVTPQPLMTSGVINGTRVYLRLIIPAMRPLGNLEEALQLAEEFSEFEDLSLKTQIWMCVRETYSRSTRNHHPFGSRSDSAESLKSFCAVIPFLLSV